MGVKKSYQQDYLETENKLQLNRLNFAAKHFSETFSTVKKLKTTVYEDYKNDIQDLRAQ